MPLELTARQQTMLAELMLVLGKPVRAILEEKTVDSTDLCDELLNWVDRFQVTNQELGLVYDKMHRTGANS